MTYLLNPLASRRVIILAGGGGTRLWPLSSAQRAKQFLPLDPQRPGVPLLVSTLQRLHSFLPSPDHPDYTRSLWFVAGTSMASDLRECLLSHQMDAFSANLILEPEARNTAPAIALATAFIAQKASQDLSLSDDNEVLIFLPADHAVADDAAFCLALDRACEQARLEQSIVTLGVIPTHPETGYGYIELEAPLTLSDKPDALSANRFVEKPTLADAERYLASGRYLWNAGVFVATVSAMKKAFLHYAPRLGEVFHDAQPYNTLISRFASMLALSFDYAVMEHLQPLVVVPVSCGWSDLGSWDSLIDAAEGVHRGDANANVTLGDNSLSDVVFCDAHGVTLWQDGQVKQGQAEQGINTRPVAIVGMEDCLIVDSPKGLLVMKRGASQHVKAALAQLSATSTSSPLSAVPEPSDLVAV
jgi:mannose-1-phosphate guanylyltransferase/mannose-6-phosphate isomerase